MFTKWDVYNPKDCHFPMIGCVNKLEPWNIADKGLISIDNEK